MSLPDFQFPPTTPAGRLGAKIEQVSRSIRNLRQRVGDPRLSHYQVTLADDHACYIPFSDSSLGAIAVTAMLAGYSSAASSGLAVFRIADGSAFGTKIAGDSTFLAGHSATALTGTTGFDTFATLSAYDSGRRLYLENRLGSTRVWTLSVMSSVNTDGVYVQPGDLVYV